MALDNYNTIPELIKKISENAAKLESGELSISELENMLNYSRDIHERIAILRFQALTKNTVKPVKEEIAKPITKEELFNEIATKKETKDENEAPSFSLNFEVEDEQPKEVQRNLIDQINEDSSKDQSINDQLSSQKKETVAEKLQNSKIDDLRKVIGLNQKFLFMNDLFEGEKAHYDYALNQINATSSLEEANNFLLNELAPKFNWDLNANTTLNFKELIKRKFS